MCICLVSLVSASRSVYLSLNWSLSVLVLVSFSISLINEAKHMKPNFCVFGAYSFVLKAVLDAFTFLKQSQLCFPLIWGRKSSLYRSLCRLLSLSVFLSYAALHNTAQLT